MYLSTVANTLAAGANTSLNLRVPPHLAHYFIAIASVFFCTQILSMSLTYAYDQRQWDAVRLLGYGVVIFTSGCVTI